MTDSGMLCCIVQYRVKKFQSPAASTFWAFYQEGGRSRLLWNNDTHVLNYKLLCQFTILIFTAKKP